MDGIYNSLQMNEITDEFDPADIANQKALTIICLIVSILFFLPAVSYKDSLFAKKLSNQLFTIFTFGIANSVISCIPVIGGIISGLISVILFILVITKIVDAVNGKIRTLPFGIEFPVFK